MQSTCTATEHTDAPVNSEFSTEVLKGLKQDQKRIPSRFLYDARGSELFEEITVLDEYYPTRTEIILLKKHCKEIAERAGENVSLIEFGSGSSKKTKYLIDALNNIHSYVPIEISRSALKGAEKDLKQYFPNLNILPIHADFTKPYELPNTLNENYHLGFFPGSTIGNFEVNSAINFLQNARDILGQQSGLVIGVDLQKSMDVLIPAYNDTKGVTAEFNLNLLKRVNRELKGNLNIEAFRHKAIYNTSCQRIEMHLESLQEQRATIMGQTFSFSKGETIHTENSHKYTIESFGELANKAGWNRLKYWTDEANLFSIHYLVPKKH